MDQTTQCKIKFYAKYPLSVGLAGKSAKNSPPNILGIWLLVLIFCLPVTLMAQDGHVASLPVAEDQPEKAQQKENMTALSKVLEKFEKEFGVEFSYELKVVDGRYVENNDLFKEGSLEQSLTSILSSLQLKYKKIGDSFYVIKHADEIKENKIEKLKRRAPHSPNNNNVGGNESSFNGETLPELLKKGLDTRVKLTQDINVSGTVTSQDDEPLPGVNVVVQGTDQGTVTDVNGNYSIDVPEESTLLFSFVGYQTKEVPVNGRSTINVSLTQEISELEEVVVVGYGQQKKVNLTGSVANISSEEIENKPVSRASQALAGELSGVTVQQGSGNPTNDGASIRIRGLGTFSQAGNEPLVLIDGIAGDIDDVNPNDIASISVLKDAASAAIYGARAANGVILIETKEGEEGKLTLNYNGYFGMQQPTEMIQYVDSWTYAEMINEALTNQGQNIRYTQEEIEKFRTGEDPDNYPNARRYKDLLNTGNPTQTDHNVRVSGGNEQNRYSLSMGYLQKNGLINFNSFDRYKMRLNLNSELNDRLDLALNLDGHRGIEKDKVSGLLGLAIKLPPTLPARKSDGTYGHIGNQEVFGTYDSKSFIRDEENYLFGNLSLNYEIIDNLTLSGRAGYRNTGFHDRNFDAEIVLDENYTKGPSDLSVVRGNNNFLTLQSILEYSQSFQNHEISVLGGYSQEESTYEWDRAYRDNFPNNELHQLSAGAEGNMQSSGSQSAWGLKSFFGRINYSFAGKYLFEANARYDGSSRFPEGKKYDLFPSFSAGWRISEENFFNITWVDNLKIRGSWGQLGNQEIGRYPYQQTLNLDHNYIFDDMVFPGAAADVLPNREIRWETTTLTDIGLDFTVWDGKLSLVADYFNKQTEDILYNISSSTVLGLRPSEQNAGVVTNKGWDFQLIHRNSIGDFSYQIRPNFSVVNNEVNSLANVERDIGQGLFIGQPIESIYGYVADGLFVDQNDIQNYPDQPYPAKPGYVRLKDISGPQGEPDGQVTPEYDRKVIGNEFPKYNYGARISAEYNNIDLSFQVQGVSGVNDVVLGNQGLAFQEGSPPQEWMVRNRWTQESPDRNAKYPRMERASEGHPHTFLSTYFMRDGSFLRIKNVQLGYSLPSTILDNINMNNLRIYFNTSNLVTFDNYYEGWDPEMNGFYPPTTVYNLGVNASF